MLYALSTLVASTGRAPVPARRRRQGTRARLGDGVVPENAALEWSPSSCRPDRPRGAHSVTRRKDGAFVINRNDLHAATSHTLMPADRLVIETMPFRTNALLERFHRRRGYAIDTARHGLSRSIWRLPR
jgi:hypothetical protein